ncbi:hypothetical protein GF314_11875 [bacterium]|nr:hypothetical protein [bacterium]
MNRWQRVALFTLTIGLLGAVASPAEPIYWPMNGHHYEVIETAVSWHEAEALAEARTWDGKQGHLCTITSQEENDFVFWEVVGGNQQTPLGDPWLGGYQNSPNSPPDENWHWVTDEPWDWTNWDDGEPNDYDEPYAELFLNFQLWGDGFWNDHHGLNYKTFVVEYSGDVVRTEMVTLSDVKALFD